MRLVDMLPGRRKRKAEIAEAKRQAQITAQREADAAPIHQHADSLIARLAAHRAQNHYGQRVNAAFEMRYR